MRLICGELCAIGWCLAFLILLKLFVWAQYPLLLFPVDLCAFLPFAFSAV